MRDASCVVARRVAEVAVHDVLEELHVLRGRTMPRVSYVRLQAGARTPCALRCALRASGGSRKKMTNVISVITKKSTSAQSSRLTMKTQH